MKPFTFDELVRIEDAVIRRVAEANLILETLEKLPSTPAANLTYWRNEVEAGRALVTKVRSMWIGGDR